MRNLKIRLADDEVAKEQNVEIQSARAVGDARRPVPAKLLLDRQQTFKQFARPERCFERHHSIHKPGLRGEAYRRSRVESRPAKQPAQRFEPQCRCR